MEEKKIPKGHSFPGGVLHVGESHYEQDHGERNQKRQDTHRTADPVRLFTHTPTHRHTHLHTLTHTHTPLKAQL